GTGPPRTDSARKAAPHRSAARRTTSASAADPGRSPWSTCTAVTRQPAWAASASRASESAPPDTAQVTARPGGGKSHRAASRSSRSSAGSSATAVPDLADALLGQAHAVEPVLRRADLRHVGEPLRPPPGGVEGPGPAVALDVADEGLALRVLLELGVDADQPLDQLGDAAALAAALAQRPGEAVGGGDVPLAGAVHGHVAVALEQAHHPADAAEQVTLVGAGQQRGQAALVQRVVARPQVLDHPGQGVEEAPGVGVDRLQRLVDQRQEVLAQP